MTALVDLTGLHLAYGDHQVLAGVDLRVEAGEAVIILGRNGCGKSTLLKTLLGLDTPQQGQVRLFGQDLETLPEVEANTLRRRMGVVFQQGALFSSMSVADNVALPLQMHTDLDEAAIGDLVAGLLDLVGLPNIGRRSPAQLSGGMRKRVALARALALGPELLCCDEPGAGLDPVAATEIDQLLLRLKHHLGTTLIVVTHQLLSIERLAGRLVMLDQCRVVFSGTLAQAKGSELPVVSSFFGAGEGR
ncbi:MAG: ATP-binding cassette domain-containing protein [Candidatus Latescibacteria bacterium]|nr:ATP-binding cassette domain-containing protein [Candidatus Latescibacterota bacterium]